VISPQNAQDIKLLVRNSFLRNKLFELFNGPAIGKQDIDHCLVAFISEFVLVYILVYAHYKKLGDKYKEVSLFPKNLKFFTLMTIKFTITCSWYWIWSKS